MSTEKEHIYKIFFYKPEWWQQWDSFVMEQSINGTFLQTRRFLNYHPKERFDDCSLMILDEKDNLVAVCPACVQYEDGKKVFFSHKGSTFGGIVISKKVYSAEKLIVIIDQLETFLKNKEFVKILYKITPNLFCVEQMDLLEYILYYMGYEEEKELNLQIDFSDYKEDLIQNLSNGKKGHVHKCEHAGLQLKELVTEQEVEEFYKILCITLDKYSLKPVHNLQELLLLKNEILKKECGFFGIIDENKLVAGSMMFYFHNIKVAHAQYLCAVPDYKKLSLSTYIYFRMIVEMKKRGFHKLSWGIASEHGGKSLNLGLTKNKEAYGSKYSVNRTFVKEL